MKIFNVLAVATIAASSLVACNRAPDLDRVHEDIAKAQADGRKQVADAQANFDKVVENSRRNVVNAEAEREQAGATNASADGNVAKVRNDAGERLATAQYNLERAKAEASYNVAKAQCEAHVGGTAKSCQESAKAAYELQMTAAKSKNEQARLRTSG